MIDTHVNIRSDTTKSLHKNIPISDDYVILQKERYMLQSCINENALYNCKLSDLLQNKMIEVQQYESMMTMIEQNICTQSNIEKPNNHDTELCNIDIQLNSNNISIPELETSIIQTHEQNTIIIDNSISEKNINITNGNVGDCKNIYLLYPNAYTARINTPSGSFYLDTFEYHKKIVYINDSIGWIIIGTNNNNFFPQNNKQKVLPNIHDSCFGSSVSISGNDSICVIGGYTKSNCIGGAWIYAIEHNVMILLQELHGFDNIGLSFQGISVSTNFDGSIIVVGGSGDNNNCGACWIFSKIHNKNEWKQLCKLCNDDYEKIYFGLNICLSSNGKLLYVCGINKLFVFSNSNDIWNMTYKLNMECISNILISYDGLYCMLNNNVIYEYENEKLILFRKYDNIIALCPSGNKIMTFNDGKICVLCKHSNNFIIEHDVTMECDLYVSAIHECVMCHNGNTIIIIGTTLNNCINIWCLTIKNNKYFICSEIKITHSHDAAMHCAISSSGKFAIICDELFNNYSGYCMILS